MLANLNPPRGCVAYGSVVLGFPPIWFAFPLWFVGIFFATTWQFGLFGGFLAILAALFGVEFFEKFVFGSWGGAGAISEHHGSAEDGKRQEKDDCQHDDGGTFRSRRDDLIRQAWKNMRRR